VEAGVPVVRPGGAVGAAPKQRPRGGRKRRRGR
jgi:hypothetical protein